MRRPGVLSTVILLVPSSVNASSGVTIEGAALAALAVGMIFWIAFATVGSFRNTLLRMPRTANCVVLLVLGAAAIVFAAGSVLLGKTTIGAGIVMEAIEPLRFWQIVKLQLGAGCMLLVLGVLAGGRSR